MPVSPLQRGEPLALLLLSGDSDLRPAVVRALERFPAVSFIILLPPGRESDDLKKLKEEWPGRVRHSRIKLAHIVKSRMPDSFEIGGRQHEAPAAYRQSRWPEVMDVLRQMEV